MRLIEHVSFSRDRIVESFLWSVGVAFEPQHSNFRNWLTKAITFIIVIDDVYDIYGSLKHLQVFTDAVVRYNKNYYIFYPKHFFFDWDAVNARYFVQLDFFWQIELQA